MNSRSLVISAVVVLVICVAAAWYLLSQPKPLPTPKTAPTTPLAVEPDHAPQAPSNSGVPPASTPIVESEKPEQPSTPKPALADWELKIDSVLRANADETQTAQMLINMLPTLPADGQTEAAQHISNLISDEQYNRVLPLVKNPNLPEEVLDVFVTDLMNRDDSVKLPALLEIAKLQNHPHHDEAKTDLEIFLDEDYGQDWAKWDQALKAYLKKQAEENAAPDDTKPGAMSPQQ